MPHDHPHDRHHSHDHSHGHSHDNPHGHGHSHAHAGHNQSANHLHSHMNDPDRSADLQALTAQFIDGFTSAADKAAYLKISGIPLEIRGDDGLMMKLVDVDLTTQWQVGTASPSFGSRELSYLPFPGDMIGERTNMGFVYVSMANKQVRDLRDVLKERLAAED